MYASLKLWNVAIFNWFVARRSGRYFGWGRGTQKLTADTASNNLDATLAPTFSLDIPVKHIAADPTW
jgi:hypothetical protein